MHQLCMLDLDEVKSTRLVGKTSDGLPKNHNLDIDLSIPGCCDPPGCM
jgi:hypothetical protein